VTEKKKKRQRNCKQELKSGKESSLEAVGTGCQESAQIAGRLPGSAKEIEPLQKGQGTNRRRSDGKMKESSQTG